MFDLSSIESTFQKIQYSVKWLFGLRLAWLVSFMLFLGLVGRMATGDVLLLGFIMAVFYIFLFMPDAYAKPRFRLISLAVTDFIFLVFGFGLSPMRSVAVILFAAAIYLGCFFARSTRQWFGATFLYLVLLLGLNLQRIFILEYFPADPAPGKLALAALFLLLMCVYAGFLGISFRPLPGAGESLQPSSQTRRMLQLSVQRLVTARSLREMLQEIQTSIVLGLGAIQVEILQITKDRATFVNFTSPEDREDEFAVDGLTGLKQCLTTREVWEAGVPGQPHRPRTGPITNTMDAIRGEFISLLYQAEGFPTAYCARIFFHRNDLGAQEKEYLDNLRDLSTIALRNLLKMEETQTERKDLAGKLQQSQKEHQALQVSFQLVSRLGGISTPKQCLDSIHEAFQQLLGHDTLLLFLAVDNNSQLQLSDFRAKQPIYMERGFTLPINRSTMGSALRKRSIVFKAALKTGEGPEEGQEDLNHFLRDNIRSMFILPLAEGAKATPYGLLVIGSGVANQFRIDQMEILGNVLSPFGTAFRKALTHAENARLQRDAQVVEAILPLFGSGESEDGLWSEIAVKLRENWPFDECQAFRYQAGTGELVSTSPGWDASEPDQTRLSLNDGGIVARVARERQPFLTGNTLRDPACQDNSAMPSSRLIVPVLLDNDLLGLVDATVNRENALTEADLRSMTALAQLLGMTALRFQTGQKHSPTRALDSLTGLHNRPQPVETIEAANAESLCIAGGVPKEPKLAELFKEILGPEGDSGPHVIENLNRVIQRLLASPSDAEMVGDILMRLVCILDYQDKEHYLLLQIPSLARAMGQRFDLSEGKLQSLVLAAKVYDIGKFVLPTGLLYAPRVLDEPEKQRVVTHVNAAVQDILRPHKVFAPVLSTVKFHHERWDGSGYPWHLKRDEIPIESQIIGLLDVFRAMATDRPYRSKLTVPKVMEAMELMKEFLFEPVLVDTLAVVLEELKIT